jgi:hypothetical protein
LILVAPPKLSSERPFSFLPFLKLTEISDPSQPQQPTCSKKDFERFWRLQAACLGVNFVSPKYCRQLILEEAGDVVLMLCMQQHVNFEVRTYIDDIPPGNRTHMP